MSDLDREERTALIELEQAEGMAFKTLKLPQVERFRPVMVSIPPEQKARREAILSEKDVVTQVYNYFKPHLPFGRIWNMIKRKGKDWVYDQYRVVVQEPSSKPVGKFVNLVEGIEPKP